MALEEKKKAGLNLCAKNDPSKQKFGAFMEAFIQGGCIGWNEVSDQGQSWYNNDFSWVADSLVSERRIIWRMWMVRQLVYFMSYLFS